MRIEIRLSDESFRYDVHSLIGSFFPGAQMDFVIPEGPADTAVVSSAEDPSRTSSGPALRNVLEGCPADEKHDSNHADTPGNGVREADTPEEEAFPEAIRRTKSEDADGKPSSDDDHYDYIIMISLGNDRLRIITSGVQRQAQIPPDLTRPQVKNLLKRTLYDAVSTDTGKTLPWGTLSGIRPVKIALGPLLAGTPEDTVRATYRNTYLVSAEKTDLAVEIAKREIRELRKADLREDDFSLYVSVPFCPTICSYCTFPSGTIGEYREIIPDYLSALGEELQAIAEMTAGRRLRTVYIGGGTPTALMPEELSGILDGIHTWFDCGNVTELTVEAGRPDTITAEHLAMLYENGTTRLSVNPQTMQQKTLDRVGRRHSTEDVYRAFSLARAAGFDDINMDLILGLPGETPEDIADTLRKVGELDPEDLTVHSLARKRASRITLTNEESGILTGNMMDRVIAFAKQKGLLPYYLYRQKNIAGNLENIGFAKDGHAGLYNILMMEEIHSVMAAGAGSITKIVRGEGQKPVRAANVADIRQYIGRLPEMIQRKRDAYC